MNLNWQGNIGPISATNGGKLQTSHGPALVAADTLLDMIYVGKSGANLWSASTLAVNFPQWETNARVDGSPRCPDQRSNQASVRHSRCSMD